MVSGVCNLQGVGWYFARRLSPLRLQMDWLVYWCEIWSDGIQVWTNLSATLRDTKLEQAVQLWQEDEPQVLIAFDDVHLRRSPSIWGEVRCIRSRLKRRILSKNYTHRATFSCCGKDCKVYFVYFCQATMKDEIFLQNVKTSVAFVALYLLTIYNNKVMKEASKGWTRMIQFGTLVEHSVSIGAWLVITDGSKFPPDTTICLSLSVRAVCAGVHLSDHFPRVRHFPSFLFRFGSWLWTHFSYVCFISDGKLSWEQSCLSFYVHWGWLKWISRTWTGELACFLSLREEIGVSVPTNTRGASHSSYWGGQQIFLNLHGLLNFWRRVVHPCQINIPPHLALTSPSSHFSLDQLIQVMKAIPSRYSCPISIPSECRCSDSKIAAGLGVGQMKSSFLCTGTCATHTQTYTIYFCSMLAETLQGFGSRLWFCMCSVSIPDLLPWRIWWVLLDGSSSTKTIVICGAWRKKCIEFNWIHPGLRLLCSQLVSSSQPVPVFLCLHNLVLLFSVTIDIALHRKVSHKLSSGSLENNTEMWTELLRNVFCFFLVFFPGREVEPLLCCDISGGFSGDGVVDGPSI